MVLFNHSGTDFYVRVGDRVAQLILEKIAVPEVRQQEEEKEEERKLPTTAVAAERGCAGFGSTGV